ncbi:hypothetical protein WJX79_004896 [Trebouxia sp. C0005]|nr:MAG: hypothetical protein FRX49_11916 [Trebouxia sp. A1-2]
MISSLRHVTSTRVVPTRPARAPAASRVSASVEKKQLVFRQATAEDLIDIKRMVLKERMNPLGLPADRFIIAEDAEGQVMGFGQLQQQPNAEHVQFLELRTLIVTNAARGQGVGSAVVKHLLETPAAMTTDVFLVTLRRSIPFYKKAGFTLVPVRQVPRALWFEAFAGSVVASLVAQDRLVVLMRPAPENTMDNSAASSQTLL